MIVFRQGSFLSLRTPTTRGGGGKEDGEDGGRVTQRRFFGCVFAGLAVAGKRLPG